MGFLSLYFFNRTELNQMEEIKPGEIIKVLIKTYPKNSPIPSILTYKGTFIGKDKNFLIIEDFIIGLTYLSLNDINQVSREDGK